MLSPRLAVALAAASALLAGCTDATPPPMDPAVPTSTPTPEPQEFRGKRILVGGTGMANPAFLAIEPIYEAMRTDVDIVVLPAMGSTGGIKAVIAGEIELAASARPLKDGEKASNVTYTLWYKDGVALFANAQLGLAELNLDDVEAIYRGDITDWSQLGLPPAAVAVFSREPEDTITKTVFKAYPGLNNATWSEGLEVVTTDQRLAELIAATPGAIGFAPVGTVRALGIDVNAVRVGGSGWDAEAVRNGSYAMVVPVGLVTGPSPTEDVRAFLEYASSPDAAAALRSAGFEG